nr:hypothetical protein [Tanacetum cinerariifolium]
MGKDTVQLETAVSTISQEYPLEFTSEYGIPEALHPELPGPEDMIVDFLEGKVGVYTKFFEFANFCLPLSQFLFDILGYYQIHLSQLSVIGAAKVSHFEINCRVLYIIPTLSLFRVFYMPSFNLGWMSFSKRLGRNTPQCYTKPLDSLKNWNNRFFWVDERVFPTVVDWRTSAPKEGMLAENTYFAEAVRILDTHRTPIQKQPEMLLCLVGISRNTTWGTRYIDLFSLIRASNPTKVKTGSRPRAAHEVPLLIVTANRVIEMEDPAATTDSSGVPSTIKRSPLDFANEAGAADQGTMAPEVPPPEDVPTTSASEAGQAEEVAAIDPSAVTESRKRGHDRVDANAPPKALRKDHADPRPTGSTRGEKSLVAIELGMASTRPVHVPESAPVDVSDPDPLSFADPRSRHPADVAQALLRHEIRSLRMPPLLPWSGLLRVAIGSQLRLRFEQEAKLLRKSVAQVARRDKRIQAREHEIKNLEALLEADADMKKAAEDKSAKLWQKLENLRALSQVDDKIRVAPGRGKCSESLELRQAFVDVVSARIAKGMGEGLRHEVEHGQAQLDLEALEAYDPEAEAKYTAALQVLKDLKYPLMDQLEGLKDTPIDVIMAALHLESNTGEDAPQWVRYLRPSSSQLTIPVYPEVHDPMNRWACKEEILLSDAIATNVSRVEKKNKCRIVCRTHGVGSAHHARFDGVPVSVPTVIPQGLALLLADAATQTESDKAT